MFPCSSGGKKTGFVFLSKKKICKWGEKFLQAYFIGQEELPGPPNPDFCGFVFRYFRHKVKRIVCCVKKKRRVSFGTGQCLWVIFRLWDFFWGGSREAWNEHSVYGFVPRMARCALHRGLWWEPGLCHWPPADFGQTPPNSAGPCSMDIALLLQARERGGTCLLSHVQTRWILFLLRQIAKMYM